MQQKKEAPRILSIHCQADIEEAAQIAADGQPIAFAVVKEDGRIYGLGGRPHALSEIAKMKSSGRRKRDFNVNPPIKVTSLAKVLKVTDLDSMRGQTLTTEEVSQVVTRMFEVGYQVLPTRAGVDLPFPKITPKGQTTHAFTCPAEGTPLHSLTQAFRNACGEEVFCATSANRSGEPVRTTYQYVLEDFGAFNLPVVLVDRLRESPEKTGESGPIIDLSGFPQEIEVLRCGDARKERQVVDAATMAVQNPRAFISREEGW